MPKRSLELNLAGFKVSKQAGTLLSTQVYEQFREMILSRRLRAGDRLPATRTLASEIGISRAIITLSFEQLILEGYLVGKPGSGTYVSETIPDLLTAASKENSKTTKQPNAKTFSLNNNFLPHETLSRNSNKEELIPFQTGTPSFDYFPYKVWYQVSNQVLKNIKSIHLGYGDALGYWPLRQQIAGYLRQARAVKCEAERVIVVTGSQQGLNLVVECLLKKGDKVWMEDPGYHGAKFSFLNREANICPVPVEKDGMDVQFAIDHFPDAKMSYVTPSHQFPLGGTMPLSKRLQLLDWAKRKNMWILEDDYDSEFRYEGRPLASLQGLDISGLVIYSGTFSKVLFPGLRLAYLVLPSVEMVEAFKKIKAMLDRQSPILDQVILTKFMEDGHFLRHLRRMRLLYAERQKILLRLLKDNLGEFIEVQASPAGMNLTGWLSPRIDIDKLKQQFEQHKLVIPFLSNYTMERHTPHGINMGYTAFSKYKLKAGVEKLTTCILQSLKR